MLLNSYPKLIFILVEVSLLLPLPLSLLPPFAALNPSSVRCPCLIYVRIFGRHLDIRNWLIICMHVWCVMNFISFKNISLIWKLKTFVHQIELTDSPDNDNDNEANLMATSSQRYAGYQRFSYFHILYTYIVLSKKCTKCKLLDL